MSLISQVKSLFATAEPSGILGLSMQQHGVSFCCIGDGYQVTCDSAEVFDGNYKSTFEKLINNDKISGQCHLVLSSKHNQIVQLDKPNLPVEELNSALRWQVKDLVTISPENMITDFYDGLSNTVGADKINVVCASKDQLTSWLASLNESNISVKSITIEEFAFASLVPLSGTSNVVSLSATR